MNKVLEMLVSLSVAGSTIVVFILLLRLVLLEVFPAKWRYMIGKMATVFYLLPIAFVMQWIWTLFIPKQTTTVPISGLPSTVQQAQSDILIAVMPKLSLPELNLSADAALLILVIWGTGALAFTIWQIFCYRKFINKLQQTRSPVPENSEAANQLLLIKEALEVRSDVLLAYSSAIRSPVLIGLRKPAIYLPMEDLKDVDLGMVFRHELIHLKRKDLWVKVMILVASALHWFNPFVHILRKDIHLWSELSCDGEVVKEMSYPERKRYGETILNVMIGSRDLPIRFCVSLSGDGKQLRRRLMFLLNAKKLKKHAIMMIAATVIAIGAIGTSTAAWAAKHAPNVNTDTKHTKEGAGNSVQYKDVGDYVIHKGVQYVKFSALMPDDQKFVIETALGAAVYVLEGYEHPMFVDELTPEEQSQVTNEEGYYSPASIARLKEFREKFPRGTSITLTHEEDPSIPSGISVTIRDLTPEESAALKKREEEARTREPDSETDTKLETITSGVTVKSAGVKEGNLYDQRPEKKQLRP